MGVVLPCMCDEAACLVCMMSWVVVCVHDVMVVVCVYDVMGCVYDVMVVVCV